MRPVVADRRGVRVFLRGVLRPAALAAAAVAGAVSCFWLRPAPTPIPVLTHMKDANGRLVVLLPGRGGHAEDFQEAGFLDTARREGLQAGVVAVDAHLAYYAKRTVVVRLHDDVFAPARARGCREVWLVGVSMGGLGALLYAERYPEDVAGIFLMAPYLGSEKTLKEIQNAGGLRAWSPRQPLDPDDYQRSLWRWLKGNLVEAPANPIPIYLGYGKRDAFAAANALLAAELPPERVFLEPGGHDWPVWKKLWEDFLKVSPLCRDAG